MLYSKDDGDILVSMHQEDIVYKVDMGTAGRRRCHLAVESGLDEKAMTVTFAAHYILPANLYSFFGEGVDPIPNSNIEYDRCGVGLGSNIFEVTPQGMAQKW